MNTKLVIAFTNFDMARADRLNDKEQLGWQGWDVSGYEGEFRDEIRKHAKKDLTQEDLVDIANYCNFLWSLLEEKRKEEK